MREVKLYGHLGATFGRSFMLDVSSATDAISALCANFPDFAKYLRKFSAPGYRVVVNNRIIGEKELGLRAGAGVIKIIPVVAGSGGRGVFQIILGAVLLVASIWFPALAPMGWAMIAGGVISMLMKPPTASQAKQADNQPSYAFNGAVNTTAQGNPVPICYGEMIVGSQVISAGISTDQVAIIRANTVGDKYRGEDGFYEAVNTIFDR